MSACEAQHPRDGSRFCRGPEDGKHAEHFDRQGTWPNEAVHAVLARADVSATHRAGEILGAHAGRPQTTEEWLEYAKPVFDRFLDERGTEPFTTCEHVWPLLVKPPEMRVMRSLIVEAEKTGRIRETHGERRMGTYHTADGHSFKENKFVPIYVAVYSNRAGAFAL